MRALLDTNVFDQLANDQTTRDQLCALIDSGDVTVVVPHEVESELAASPFGGVPEWVTVTRELDSVSVLPFSCGTSRLGSGDVYLAHLGCSQKRSDAKIADAAGAYVDVFVSEDDRCRNRARKMAPDVECLDYQEFQRRLGLLYGGEKQ